MLLQLFSASLTASGPFCYCVFMVVLHTLLIYIVSAKLRGSVWDGDDVVRVEPRLWPWTVHLRSRPTAGYAAAEIHRWGCLFFFLSAPPSTCLSVLWLGRRVCLWPKMSALYLYDVCLILTQHRVMPLISLLCFDGLFSSWLLNKALLGFLQK